ncbi:hypothetical protein [Pseudomonas sp. RIT-PI-S]|uniref:hypothetical protein n=1 Tax=Pseudomonas sp. RIT-PI-S TaxID=3035295 RepID=UPI0021D7D502|nr:hypothetical protein [Pseudomonas sp. RIT-PI-S]
MHYLPKPTLLAAAAVAVSLAGCALRGNDDTEARRAAAERQARQQAMAMRVLAQPRPLDTALKMAPNAMALIDVPAQGAEPATQARLFANCDTQTLSMDYRSASGWTAVFAVAAPAPTAQATARELCQAVGSGGWRHLPGEDKDVLMIDPSSLIVKGGQRLAWVGIDYERIRLSEAQDNDYSGQIERIAVDCSTRQASARQVYRMDESSLLPPPAQPLGSALTAAQRGRLIDALCAAPATLDQLAKAVVRRKLPPNLATPQVPPALLAQVGTLPQGQPIGTLSHLQFSSNATLPIRPDVKVTDSPLDLYLEKGPGPGLWRVQTADVLTGDQVSIRWRGLIDLATVARQEPAGKLEQGRSPAGVELIGDWQNIKAGSDISYIERSAGRDGKALADTFACKVGDSAPAAQTVASLQGAARRVVCRQSAGLEKTRAYLYLEAYDLFVQTADISMLIVRLNTLKVAQ